MVNSKDRHRSVWVKNRDPANPKYQTLAESQLNKTREEVLGKQCAGGLSPSLSDNHENYRQMTQKRERLTKRGLTPNERKTMGNVDH